MAAFFLRAKDGKQPNSLAVLYIRLRPWHSATESHHYPQVCGTRLHTNDTDSAAGALTFIGTSSYKHSHPLASRPAVS